MQIMNNSAAMAALGEVKKNDTTLGKQLKKVASGMKINGAGNGAAEYAISEKMRVRTRALDQDIENAQTGKNLVCTAEGGIQNIINNLRSMKALAIDAANDTNTDDDRAIIQKEQDSRIQTIDDIANSTSYNGKLLLNGNYGKRLSASSNSAKLLGTTRKVIPSGDYTINNDGIYVLSSGYSGHITINAKNVKITQENTAQKLYNVSMECTQADSSLWLDNVDICDGSTNPLPQLLNFNSNVVKFNGSGNTLHIQNSVTLIGGCNSGRGAWDKAVINVGEGLDIYGEGMNSRLVAIAEDGYIGDSYGTAIGTDRQQQSNANINISGLSYLRSWSEMGSGIGSGVDGSVGNISIKELRCLPLTMPSSTR